MAKFEIFYPVRPWFITQGWGILHPEYPESFGFKLHNGIDILPGLDNKILAPLDGSIYRIGFQPNGGGIFVGFISKNIYEFPDGISCRVVLDFLHCKEIIGKLDKDYGVGELLAIADNTGYSTGPHTHIQLRRVQYDGVKMTFLDSNGANNSFDPIPYFNGVFADTALQVEENILSLSLLFNRIMNFLKGRK